MIIEIRDLPIGRKLKHINVDVTFEDEGDTIVKTAYDGDESIKIPDEYRPEPPMPEKRVVSDSLFSNIAPPDKSEAEPTRESKPVPSEMLNQEF